jgi:hypothetical protein
MPEMVGVSREIRFGWAAWGLGLAVLSGTALGQREEHGRKYKEPPPTAHIVVTVEKGFNGKPLPNAAVVFHAMRDGRDSGNLELKTDPDGKATIDVIEVGSHLTVQVIAGGFATFATDFDVTGDGKDLLVKLQRPRAQVSEYGDNSPRPSDLQPGIQEPHHGIAVAPGLAATATSAIVSGRITDLGGADIPGAVVTFVDESGKLPPARVLTGSDGRFRKADVPPGTYDVEVSAIGFETQTHRHVVLERGEEQIFDDKLPAPQPQAATAGSPQ